MALNGKLAAVTGAAMGIGRAMTEILLQNGAKVALLDVNETAGKSLLEVLGKQYGRDRILFLHCDVESEEQMKAESFLQLVTDETKNGEALLKTSESFGGMDILCNNAGMLNEGMWEKTICINLMGVIRGTYLALEHMSKLSGGRGGVIVNTASMAGVNPFPSCPVYTATKYGVVGFTRTMANNSEASGYGIRINALCPSFVQTEMFTAIPFRLGQHTHMTDSTQQMIDKVGVLTVSDVAESFLQLVTDETKNGEALLVMPKEKKYMTFESFL